MIPVQIIHDSEKFKERVRDLPSNPARALDFVNTLERKRWIPRSVVRFFMKRYVSKYTLPSHRMVLDTITEGDVVVDLGANVGLFSVYFAEKGATVYAYEPDPYAFEILQAYARPFSRVNLRQEAVCDLSGQLKLYRHHNFENDHNYAQSSTLVAEKANVNQDNAVNVTVVDVFDVVSAISGRIKLVKIDIEGAEAKVVKRLLDTGMLEKIDHVFVETHEDIVPGLGEQLKVLQLELEKKYPGRVDFSWY